MRRAAVRLIALAGLTLAVPAFAQSSNEAAAQRLFDEGRTLMTASRYDEACQKFEASEKLSPAGGTLFNLGDCYEKAGKPASAWARYNEAADRSAALKRPDAEKFARDRASALAGSLAYIQVEIDPSLKGLAGLTITIDDAPLAPAGWDTPIPADPGPHAIRATAPGNKPWSAHVTVAGRGSTIAARIDALEDEPVPPRESPRPVPLVDTSRGSTQRIVGLGVGAIGIVGVGIGSFFGLAAMSKHGSIDCPNDVCASTDDKAKNDDARTDATISTIAFAAGGALLAGGIVLYLTAPKEGSAVGLRVVPSVAQSGARLGLEGHF